jgi:enamine deaminase RidA (YjgF/YER057c/UK114 family)
MKTHHRLVVVVKELLDPTWRVAIEVEAEVEE